MAMKSDAFQGLPDAYPLERSPVEASGVSMRCLEWSDTEDMTV